MNENEKSRGEELNHPEESAAVGAVSEAAAEQPQQDAPHTPGLEHQQQEQQSEEHVSHQQQKRGRRRILTGVVVSNKMQKTITVLVERRVAHPLYKKYYKKRKKFLAHDEKNECQVGDVVRIMETRPLSKRKRWRLVAILKKAEREQVGDSEE